MRLSREKIVGAALQLLDRHGLRQLTLRRIADELGVQAPAFYWHIRSREELLGLMADELLFEALAATDATQVGQDFLIAFGRAIAHSQQSRRDAAELLATCPPTERGRACVSDQIIPRLREGGVANSSEAAMAVFAFTLGWSLLVSRRPMKAHLASGMDLEPTFEAGLHAIAAGFMDDAAPA